MIELVERPKTMPGPPVASITASAGKARISIVRRSMATLPTHPPGLVLHRPQPLPVLVLGDHSGRLAAAHLLVERVEQLLAGGGAGEGGPVVERPAEATEVEEALRGAVERHAHPVEQVDDARRRVAHAAHAGLLGEEVPAAKRVLDVDVGVVTLALGVHRAVDPALGADRVRALHRDDGEQVHLVTGLAELDDRHQPRQPAAHHRESRFRHGSCSLISRRRRSATGRGCSACPPRGARRAARPPA